MIQILMLHQPTMSKMSTKFSLLSIKLLVWPLNSSIGQKGLLYILVRQFVSRLERTNVDVPMEHMPMDFSYP